VAVVSVRVPVSVFSIILKLYSEQAWQPPVSLQSGLPPPVNERLLFYSLLVSQPKIRQLISPAPSARSF
jgi:hypothetical protein